MIVFRDYQGGQNVRIVRIFLFCNPKIVRIFFLNCTDCTYFYPGNRNKNYFHSFQQIFMKISKKNSRQNEVSLTYFLHIK